MDRTTIIHTTDHWPQFFSGWVSWLGYCFSPYQRLWLYNGARLVAFYDTLGIRRTYSRLKPPASSRGHNFFLTLKSVNKSTENLNKKNATIYSVFDKQISANVTIEGLFSKSHKTFTTCKHPCALIPIINLYHPTDYLDISDTWPGGNIKVNPYNLADVTDEINDELLHWLTLMSWVYFRNLLLPDDCHLNFIYYGA